MYWKRPLEYLFNFFPLHFDQKNNNKKKLKRLYRSKMEGITANPHGINFRLNEIKQRTANQSISAKPKMSSDERGGAQSKESLTKDES